MPARSATRLPPPWLTMFWSTCLPRRSPARRRRRRRWRKPRSEPIAIIESNILAILSSPFIGERKGRRTEERHGFHDHHRRALTAARQAACREPGFSLARLHAAGGSLAAHFPDLSIGAGRLARL